MIQTERLESMSPRGFLRLIRQDDGDIIISIGEGDEDGGWRSFATIEFCTPFSGGGGSEKTWEALVQLGAAMAADNLDDMQGGRRPPHVDDDEQRRWIEWADQCRRAKREFNAGT